MDKELMELLDQKLFVFSKRDDVEKLRQETSANFRKLKEENKELILGWIEGIKTEMEELRREGKVDFDPIRDNIKDEIRKLELKIQSMLLQSIQSIESSLQRIREEATSAAQPFQKEVGSTLQAMREETSAAILRSGQEMASNLRLIREEGRTNLAQTREETKVDFNRLGEGVGNLSDQIRKTTEEIMALNEKIKEGFNEVKEELGSMIKFSYADLEKRFGTLEARVKALEKLVLP
ncbi:MAG: hypothetical protein KG012_14625 [Deltaproteobacteria bacterium]|nr:hypothetical protein [Deltaproteobacteria bacterium]